MAADPFEQVLRSAEIKWQVNVFESLFVPQILQITPKAEKGQAFLIHN